MSQGEGRTPSRTPGSVSYNAAIESAEISDTDEPLSDFTNRVEREATRRGFNAPELREVIGDSARSIWSIAD